MKSLFRNNRSTIHRISLLGIFLSILVYSSCKNANEDFANYLTFLGDDKSPKILSASPGMGDSSLPRTQKIAVVFNKPMNINSCVQSFSISPPVQGFYELNDFSMIFTPSSLLSFGTYTYTISKNCEDKDGNDLRDIFTASFTIGEPTIAGTFPEVTGIFVKTGSVANCNTATAIDTNILSSDVTNACMGNNLINRMKIRFNRDMERIATSGSITISPNVNFTLSWINNQEVDIIPDSPFAFNSRITLTLSTQAQDSQGIRLVTPVIGSFRVGSGNLLPTITSINIPADTLTNCNNGVGVATDILTNTVNNGCLGNPTITPIEINFSHPMDTPITQSAITFSPSITGSFVWSNANQTVTFNPDQKFTFGQRYTLNISTIARTIDNINLQILNSFGFVAGGLLSAAPVIQAVGVASQGCANTLPGVGNAAGGDWTSGNCFWDNSLPILSPSNYRFRAGDVGNGSSGSNLSCLDVNTDNFRLIFSNYMDLNSTINAVRLRRTSPPTTTIQLASWNWEDCQAVAPFGCRVLNLTYAEQESSCNGSLFGNALTGGDFNLLRSDNTPAGFPYYNLSVDTSARDVNNIPLTGTFNFTMEAK
ncbi:MAG: Ig-like domain-containing protein [Leptospiraceae bacterium]|nr:Ig-like domain-containing protein [Leptospiraceae bacterium]